MTSRLNLIPGVANQATSLPPTLNTYDWFDMLFETSRLLTFVVSIGIILYGSRRALEIEERLKEDESSGKNKDTSKDDIFTIDSRQAVFFPLGASCSLLCFFFFFSLLQFFFLILVSVMSVVTLSFVLLPACSRLPSLCFSPTLKINMCCFGRVSSSESLSVVVSLAVVVVWALTGNWVLMDVIGVAFCVTMIAYIRLPSLKVATYLLVGLLFYDIFWVFISEYIFAENVMVKVATQPAYNPVNYVSKKLHVERFFHVPTTLSMPAKLVFPSYRHPGRFSMLGLGDIVLPGICLCFVLRFDGLKKNEGRYTSNVTYFPLSMFGYFIGLLMATTASEVFMVAQPALLYLVPCILVPLVTKAYWRSDLRGMWNDPFHTRREGKTANSELMIEEV